MIDLLLSVNIVVVSLQQTHLRFNVELPNYMKLILCICGEKGDVVPPAVAITLFHNVN